MNGQEEVALTLEEANKIIALQRAELEKRAIENRLLTEQIESAKIYENNYVNTKETAILLDVKPRTVRSYNIQGKITGRKHKKEGKLFFSLKEVLAFRKRSLKHWAYFD